MTPDYPPVYILRHGQTEWNVEGRFQGQLDSPLTATGLAQAASQNAILRRHLADQTVNAICSTAGRARGTADIALKDVSLAAPLAFDPRLQEIHFGDWQGLTRAEMEAGWPDQMAAADPATWQFFAPGGETLDVMAERVRAVLAGLTGPTVIVTHGVTSRLIRCEILGIAPERLAELPGGQGNVHHIENGEARVITDEDVQLA